MKITKLRVRRFRGFHSELELPLGAGQNLLLYGDNGTGKSSLYDALRELLAATPRAITPHRNLFAAQNENPEVEVEYHPALPGNSKALWDHQGHPLDHRVNRLDQAARLLFQGAAIRAAFLDYRSLLKTSVPKQRLAKEFLGLTAGTLLRGFEVSVDGKTRRLGDLFESVQRQRDRLLKKTAMERANEAATAFNEAFLATLPQLEAKITELLVFFPSLFTSVRFDYAPFKWPGEDREEYYSVRQGGTLKPIVTFKNLELDHHPDVLNEARLSALAVCILLAGVLISDVDPANPDHPRLIVLDDALISLDAVNRSPVLEILQSQHFQHFQILLLTHDSVWFDIARNLLSGWKACKLIAERPEREDEPSVPLFETLGHTGPLLDIDIAEKHLNHDDKPAAAVYARSAFEKKLKNIAQDNPQGIKLPFRKDPKEVTANSLWQTIKAWNAALPNRLFDLALETSIEAFRSNVLNELSHSEPRNWDVPTIQTALTALRTFCNLPCKPTP